MDELTRKWLARARYDLKTAESMLEARRYLYVGFMCQQSLEKLLKAIMVSKGKKVIPIHNLVRLAQEAGVYETMNESEQNFLADLTPFVIEARHGDYRRNLSEITNKRQASGFLSKAKELFKCLKRNLI